VEQPGRHIVQLRYWPRAFYAGLLVSATTLAFLAFVCWAQATERLRHWSRKEQSLVASVSRGIIWLVE
jgi:hypothetical protein